MNTFEQHISHYTGNKVLNCIDITTIQVNTGLKCNQKCSHCHLEASPSRTEMMDWSVMEKIIETALRIKNCKIDITGGAPELNPYLKKFIKKLSANDHTIQIRTNLTILCEPQMETYPKLFRDYNVHIMASLPCYLEENVRAQRGEGVYEKSILMLRRLNSLGYGIDPNLTLNLIYNPSGAYLPPELSDLEEAFRKFLSEQHGITFTHLITIANMPIGRFYSKLRKKNKQNDYFQLLIDSFNSLTLENIMCRHQISVDWNGTLFDCDFNIALGVPVDHGAPDQLDNFVPKIHAKRRIVTGEHCYVCTAGKGSSCEGVLI